MMVNNHNLYNVLIISLTSLSASNNPYFLLTYTRSCKSNFVVFKKEYYNVHNRVNKWKSA